MYVPTKPVDKLEDTTSKHAHFASQNKIQKMAVYLLENKRVWMHTNTQSLPVITTKSNVRKSSEVEKSQSCEGYDYVYETGTFFACVVSLYKNPAIHSDTMKRSAQ